MIYIIIFSVSSCEKQEVTPPVNNIENDAVLYIGTENTEYKEYEFYVKGEITPEKLIGEIENLTGWNLELSDEVTSGKGGMSVCFTKNCSLFSGPPNPQKDEFHVYDRYQLARIILDSVKKTL